MSVPAAGWQRWQQWVGCRASATLCTRPKAAPGARECLVKAASLFKAHGAMPLGCQNSVPSLQQGPRALVRSLHLLRVALEKEPKALTAASMPLDLQV